jgi:hypothetical protein
MMFSMFVLWFLVFVGIFMRRAWVPTLAIVAMVWTLVLLVMHMSDPIPLNF